MPLDIETVMSQILTLNNTGKPYRIERNKNQIIGYWSIIDAEWYWLKGKLHEKKYYILTIDLDASNHQFSYNEKFYDSEGNIKVSDGKLGFGAHKKIFIGPQWNWGAEVVMGFGMKVNGGPRKFFGVAEYNFNTPELKDPILNVLKNAGWVGNFNLKLILDLPQAQ